ncbi:MAG: polyribonucleotide nucleotidyltransferase [Dehalococcoidia bacterium]|nr:polyribonucleotide nucleotidyltransferase [Dehalococcoidia bacterium]
MSGLSDFSQIDVGGHELIIETGKLAEQAGGAVTVRYGDTVAMVTACVGNARLQEDRDFVPLTVDLEERLYAAGRIPGSFFRREGRAGQESTLTMRLIDRSVRPLFPKGFRNEVQVIVHVLSADQENDPDILSIVGASAALGLSGAPFDGPVGAVRVGYVNGDFVINPTYAQLAESQLDLVVAGTKEAVIMVEAGAKEVSEQVVLEAIKLAQEANFKIIEGCEKFIEAHRKPQIKFEEPHSNERLQQEAETVARSIFSEGLEKIDRAERQKREAMAREKMTERLGDACSAGEIKTAMDAWVKKEMRSIILEKGVRLAGRKVTEIRPISCEVGLLPRTHGSALFSRGQTQVLTITTLGSLKQEQMIDSISPEESKRYMHHYNFPPFSTGEIKRLGTGRREIGHGALAERALLPVIPDEDAFPYAIRLVSEVLSSNGSSSMASVCGSTLSLMDAGVPIKAPVAGIAMGLITGEEGKFAILTDIEGVEDFFGDMDFKVAGTADGITALQMDIKTRGMTYEIIEAGLKQAKEARLFILDRMKETISASRPTVSEHAPKMTKIKINPDKIRDVIGPGGRTIRSITEQTNTDIKVEQDGTIVIGAPNEEAAKKAISIIESLTMDPEIGMIYTGKVTSTTGFGAFVEILPGRDGLLHISELANYRVAQVEDVVSVGDEVTVMVIGIDPQGKIKLSRRALLDPAGPQDRPQGSRSPEGGNPGGENAAEKRFSRPGNAPPPHHPGRRQEPRR